MNDLMLSKLDVSKCNVTKHLISNAGTPTIAATTAGDGTCTISGDDVCGYITFADTWADSDTAVVTFDNAYDNAPTVLITCGAVINASGVSPVEIDTIATTTTSFTLTASGTCAGAIGYLVIGQ